MENEGTLEAKGKMDKTIENFKQEIAGIRTGRAAVGLLDSIEVEVYGSTMKLNQVATVAAPEARLLTIQPWDKTQMAAIEKAIQTSPLGLTPNNDGTIIRLPIPELTEERRKDYMKLVGRLGEDARVSLRNIRRHAVEEIKKGQKSGDIPEDDAHKLTTEVQKHTDGHVSTIEQTLKHKEKEIMEV